MGPGQLLSFAFWIWLLPATIAKAIRQVDMTDSEPPPECLLYNLNSLLHLDCSNLRLTRLPDELNYEAQVLLLRDNEFDEFPPQIQYFTELQVLDMANNFLNSPLPNYFENMQSLLTLNLSNNQYSAWADTGRMYHIRNLDLSRNKIVDIDETAFSRLPRLRFLDLSENKISDLSIRTFADTTVLDTLHLSRNYFTTVPKFQSSSLKSLDLSSCQISTLEKDALADMSSILELLLSMNQIERITDDFGSDTLQELDLSYNDINTLTDNTFSSLPHLAVLNLRGNDFKEVFPTSHFASNPFLREIHLKGNRWSCDGFNINLLLTYEFLTKEPPKEDSAALICYSPANVTQMSWHQAYIRTWHPNANATMSYWSFAMFVGIIIGVVVTSCICRCLMQVNDTRTPRPPRQTTTVVNLNGAPRVAVSEESVVLRVPLREEDLPPSYDEALLMPPLRASFHSLPDFVDEEGEEEQNSRTYRRSRSIGDLTASRPRTHDRRSTRRTLQIHRNNNDDSEVI